MVNHFVPKLQLGDVNCAGSSASTIQRWNFASHSIPKLELGNEKRSLGTRNAIHHSPFTIHGFTDTRKGEKYQ
jgi:hypothetical protein